MAKINMTKVRAVMSGGTRVAVIGHNRTLERDTDGRLIGRLHGNPIITLGDGVLTLRTCGYETVTTRQAIQDISAAIGAPVSVSFARGGRDARCHSSSVLLEWGD